jgi:hypothetical protein
MNKLIDEYTESKPSLLAEAERIIAPIRGIRDRVHAKRIAAADEERRKYPNVTTEDTLMKKWVTQQGAMLDDEIEQIRQQVLIQLIIEQTRTKGELE